MTRTNPHFPFTDCAADRIDALGEVALLEEIRTWLGEASPPAPQGIGDDCAVWAAPPAGKQLLLTTDAVVYGRHFDATCPPELAAGKLLKRNLSDIAAMGGTPHSALLALTLPRNLSLRWLERFYRGLRECSLKYQTPITGGDITEGTDNFFAAHITLIGHAERPLLRSGAQAGDHLFVSGALGGSLFGHHLHFEPRLAVGRWLAAQPDVHAMIDLTDGLAKDLPELLPPPPTKAAEGAKGAGTKAGKKSAGAEEGEKTCESAADKKGAEAQKNARDESNEPTPPTAVALLDLAALPISAVVEQNAPLAAPSISAAAQEGNPSTARRYGLSPSLQPHATTPPQLPHHLPPEAQSDGVTPPQSPPQPLPETPPQPPPEMQPDGAKLAPLLFDGEDYELLFAVDGQTDPTEFIARWQRHFGQTQAPVSGTPTSPQPAYPYRIGSIALVPNHPATALRLYDAATRQPLKLDGSGFEHLKS